MAPCVVHTDIKKCVALIRITGSLVYEDVKKVSAFVRQELARDVRGVILDLAGVDRVNSKGLGAIISAHSNALRKGIPLVIWNPSESLRQLLEHTKLTSVLTIVVGDEAAAYKAVGKNHVS